MKEPRLARVFRQKGEEKNEGRLDSQRAGPAEMVIPRGFLPSTWTLLMNESPLMMAVQIAAPLHEEKRTKTPYGQSRYTAQRPLSARPFGNSHEQGQRGDDRHEGRYGKSQSVGDDSKDQGYGGGGGSDDHEDETDLGEVAVEALASEFLGLVGDDIVGPGRATRCQFLVTVSTKDRPRT